MQVRSAISIAAATALLLGGSVAVGAHAASAGSGESRGDGDQPPSQVAHVTHATLADSAAESIFVPIAPCRIVDTRTNAGAIAAGSSRTFSVDGTASLGSQGGNTSGCGVPASANAIAASVVATGVTGSGFLRGWASGQAQPTSSFLNFGKGTTSTAAVLPLAAAATKQLTIQSEGTKTQVVIDVDGYYTTQLYANINSDGTTISASRVTESEALATGQYEVDFDRDVSACAATVSAFGHGDTGITEPRSSNADGVFVLIENNAGTIVNDEFALTVTC